VIRLPLFVTFLCRWMHQDQNDVIAFLREENRVLKAQLRGRRLRLSDHPGGARPCVAFVTSAHQLGLLTT
jgi:hypothetical protein